MVVAHLTGRGAAELVRFWGEPPLVREPDLALFGTDRIDPSEAEALNLSFLRRYDAAHVKRAGAAAAARIALERTHSNGHEFVLHFDVDVIADFQATNYPGSGGLTLDEVREDLEVFALEKNLAAIEVTAYNPAKDPDGSGAKIIIDLLADILEKRLEAFKAAAPVVSTGEAAAAKPEPTAPAVASEEPVSPREAETSTASETPVPPAAPGEAWSSDSLDDESDDKSGAAEELPEAAGESGESPS
jgi:hypothetical protein